MIKYILLSIIFLLQLGKSYSQWNIVTVGTAQDLYSVDYYSLNDIWIGSFNQIVTTNNGGGSWNIIHPKETFSGSYLLGNIFDLELTSSTSAIGTGFFNIGNDELILTTTDGGNNWNFASWNNTVPLPRYINSVDVFSARAVTVGNNGRIAQSTNSGSTWAFVSSGTSNLISDVQFSTIDTVFAVGDNVILKSVDGGLTWALTTVSGSFKTVSCRHEVVYVGESYSGILRKSTDYGVTYTNITLPFAYNGVVYAVTKDTVLAASDGLYVSTSGGQYWEKYILSNYKSINMLDFYNNNSGIAVGDSGYVIETNNLSSAPTLPISLFSIQGGNSTFCLGDSITLINSTAPLPGYSYQWQIDNSTFSAQYNSGIVLNVSSGTHTISLIASNGNGSDTATKQITVLGHDLQPFVMITNDGDTICKGNAAGFLIPNSQNGVTYQLRKGFSNIGTAISGNGDTLYFSSMSSTDSITSFNIKAVKTNSCFTDSIIEYHTIYVSNSMTTAACIPDNFAFGFCTSPYCTGITSVTFNAINNSTFVMLNNYVDYSCCKHTDVTLGNTYSISVRTHYIWGEYVKVWIDYNNDGVFDKFNELAFAGSTSNQITTGSITIPAAIALNNNIRMRVSSSTTSLFYDDVINPCNMDFYQPNTQDYSITILPAPTPPTSTFSFTTTVACSTTATCTNTSYNATSYLWDFGDSATSALLNPSHIYTISGSYNIKLIACNPYGCDTITQVVNIIIPQVPIPATCTPIIWTGYVGVLHDFHFDTLSPINTSAGYHDFTCTKQLYVHAASTYTMSTSYNWSGGGNCAAFRAWIDYNNDGSFSASELINGYNNTVCCGGGTFCGIYVSVQIPDTAVQNTPLRMRTLVYDDGYDGWITSGCEVSGIHGGQIQDFTIFIGPVLPDTADFTANITTACTSDYVNFTNSSVNASHYLWDFGDGTTDTVADPNAHQYASAGTYTVKLIVSNSVYSDSLIKTNYITVSTALPVPVITLSGTQLSTTAVAPSYQWYRNNVLISGATSSTYNLTQDGDYTLVITNTNGCKTSSSVYSYYPIHPNFSTGIWSSVCDSVQIIFANSSTNVTGSTAYTVYWGDGDSLSYNGLGGLLHTYYSSGAYQVKLIACNGSVCDSIIHTENIIIVTVPPSMPGTISGNIAICEGSSNTYSIIAVTGATDYTWTLSSGWSGSSNSNSISATANSTSGNITVTANNICGSSPVQTLLVTVHSIPTISGSGDTTLCQGSTVTLTADSGSAYLWSTGATTQSITVSSTGYYYVAVTTTDSSCTSTSNPVSITIGSNPNYFYDSNCYGMNTNIYYDFNGCIQPSAYYWDFGDAASGAANIDSTSGGYVSHLFSSAGNYTVTMLVTDGSQKDTVVQTIHIYSALTVFLGNDTTIQTGNTIMLNAGNPGSYYYWSTGESTQTIFVTDSGTYYVDVADSAGCFYSSDTIHITINPSANYLYDSNCSGMPTNIYYDFNSSFQPSAYYWNFGDTASGAANIDSTSGSYVSHLFSSAGNYLVTMLVSNGSQEDTVVQTIHIYSALIVFLGNDTTIQTGDTIMLNAGNPGSYYYWSTGESTQTIFVTDSGTYYADVSDSAGCFSGSDTIYVALSNLTGQTNYSDKLLFTISPNPTSGKFYLKKNPLVNLKIEIYNVLGEKIYQQIITSSNPDLRYGAGQQIDISSFSRGVYFVKVQSGEKLFVQKIVYQ